MTKSTQALLLSFFLAGGCMPAPEGQSGTRDSIIGGSADSSDPAVVALQSPDGSPDCTASLVSARLLLTAAHCVEVGQRYRAAFGPHQTSPTSTIDVLETHADLAFASNWGGGHDVAVAILATPSTVAPIDVDRSPLPSTMLGQNVRLVGYGLTDTNNGGGEEKREITLRVDEVNAQYLRVGVPGRAACSGDSGGPAFSTSGRIIGITSYGTDDDCSNGITYYSRVDANLAFLAPYLDGSAAIGGGDTGPAPMPGSNDKNPGGSDPGNTDPGCDAKADPSCTGTGTDPGSKDPGTGGTGCDPKTDPTCTGK